MLATERLILSEVQMADVPRIHAWRNDDEIQVMSADDSTSEAIEATERRVTRWIGTAPTEAVYFGIRLGASRGLIGFSVIALIEQRHRRCRLSIVLGEKSLWGQGYGTEACRALVRYCFEDLRLNRIGAEAYASNPRSFRMLERVGFVREGILRQSVWKPDPVDEYVYGLLRQDWRV